MFAHSSHCFAEPLLCDEARVVSVEVSEGDSQSFLCQVNVFAHGGDDEFSVFDFPCFQVACLTYYLLNFLLADPVIHILQSSSEAFVSNEASLVRI